MDVDNNIMLSGERGRSRSDFRFWFMGLFLCFLSCRSFSAFDASLLYFFLIKIN